MAASRTPPPMDTALHPDPVTDPMNVEGVTKDDGSVAALIGGVVAATLLIFVSVMAFLWWCRPGQKGSYTTNEMVDKDNGDNDDDEESVGSETALKHNETLEVEEDE
ncbi:small cell adhesion glycoprotein homolog [Nerophis ophidion]|uniref:small cell adhesion glycoprotein homolog n=1 Tax=Nerophis ophidion TaxID=159077 RepID=UPI002AE00DB2|nr:small cell adhesion glycoprotein homolog [Nerophis ophidion]